MFASIFSKRFTRRADLAFRIVAGFVLTDASFASFYKITVAEVCDASKAAQR